MKPKDASLVASSSASAKGALAALWGVKISPRHLPPLLQVPAMLLTTPLLLLLLPRFILSSVSLVLNAVSHSVFR
jgi:hypothetical protein